MKRSQRKSRTFHSLNSFTLSCGVCRRLFRSDMAIGIPILGNDLLQRRRRYLLTYWYLLWLTDREPSVDRNHESSNCPQVYLDNHFYSDLLGRCSINLSYKYLRSIWIGIWLSFHVFVKLSLLLCINIFISRHEQNIVVLLLFLERYTANHLNTFDRRIAF